MRNPVLEVYIVFHSKAVLGFIKSSNVLWWCHLIPTGYEILLKMWVIWVCLVSLCTFPKLSKGAWILLLLCSHNNQHIAEHVKGIEEKPVELNWFIPNPYNIVRFYCICLWFLLNPRNEGWVKFFLSITNGINHRVSSVLQSEWLKIIGK